MRLIISDACIGLSESAAEFYPDARDGKGASAWAVVVKLNEHRLTRATELVAASLKRR